MAKKKVRSKKKEPNETDAEYAHNPRYCMIRPDANKPNETSVSSTGQS